MIADAASVDGGGSFRKAYGDWSTRRSSSGIGSCKYLSGLVVVKKC
jgi:hypothetical protein